MLHPGQPVGQSQVDVGRRCDFVVVDTGCIGRAVARIAWAEDGQAGGRIDGFKPARPDVPGLHDRGNRAVEVGDDRIGLPFWRGVEVPKRGRGSGLACIVDDRRSRCAGIHQHVVEIGRDDPQVQGVHAPLGEAAQGQEVVRFVVDALGDVTGQIEIVVLDSRNVREAAGAVGDALEQVAIGPRGEAGPDDALSAQLRDGLIQLDLIPVGRQTQAGKSAREIQHDSRRRRVGKLRLQIDVAPGDNVHRILRVPGPWIDERAEESAAGPVLRIQLIETRGPNIAGAGSPESQPVARVIQHAELPARKIGGIANAGGFIFVLVAGFTH